MTTQFDPRLSANICQQCGKSQNDDYAEHGIHAPMLHLGVAGVPFMAMTAEHIGSYHLDCLPHEVEAAHRPQHGEAIDAAKAGKRGDELHAVIHAARAKFEALEKDFIDAEQAKFAKTGIPNHDAVHPMYSKAGA